MFTNYICVVDIGSSKISAVVGRLGKKHFTEIFFESIPSKGVSKGIVVDAIALTNCLSSLLKGLKAKSGINIKAIYANISGEDILTKHSFAVLPLAERGNKVIAYSDINNAIEQARLLGSSLEEEIIHQIPYSYSIDSKNNITQPLGLYSHKLEVNLFLICAKIAAVQTLNRVVNQAGFELKNLFLSGIATSKVIFNNQNKEGLNVFCDIGNDITEVLIFKDGLLKVVEILPIGASELTQGLSQELNIPFELAEEVKKSYSSLVDPSLIPESQEVLIKKDNIYKPVKQRDIAQIMNLRAQQLCQQIKDTVAKNYAIDHLKNFIVVGGITFQDGFLEILEKVLGISVNVGRINSPEISQLLNSQEIISGSKYMVYITCLGMLAQAKEMENERIILSTKPTNNIFFKTVNKVKEVYQEYF